MVRAHQMLQSRLEPIECRRCDNIAEFGSRHCSTCLKVSKNREVDKYWLKRAACTCVTCDAPVPFGDANCQECRDYENDMRDRNKYIRLGLCRDCGKEPIDVSGVICVRCKAKVIERSRLTYQRRKDNGDCVDCEKNKAIPNRVRCQGCLDASREQDRKRYLAKKKASSSVHM